MSQKQKYYHFVLYQARSFVPGDLALTDNSKSLQSAPNWLVYSWTMSCEPINLKLAYYVLLLFWAKFFLIAVTWISEITLIQFFISIFYFGEISPKSTIWPENLAYKMILSTSKLHRKPCLCYDKKILSYQVSSDS